MLKFWGPLSLTLTCLPELRDMTSFFASPPKSLAPMDMDMPSIGLMDVGRTVPSKLWLPSRFISPWLLLR